MKLATLRSSRKDGTLVVVSRDLRQAVAVPEIAPTLQAAIDEWDTLAPRLQAVYDRLNRGKEAQAKPFDQAEAASPLPRSIQWCDGSVYAAHHERMCAWQGVPVPEHVTQKPVIYQGGSDFFWGPREDIRFNDEAQGMDFEAEVAVITADVPMGAKADEIRPRILLMMLANDVSLRNLIPAEIKRGFGAYQSKPSSSFSPVAVTLDELGEAWDGAKLHLPVITTFRGGVFGRPNAGVEMTFGFPEIIAYAAETRDIGAGSIFGSGTVSNSDPSVGSSCITERRVIEAIETGKSKTEYMRFGESVRIEVFGKDGQSIFGAIDQKVVRNKSVQL